MDKKYILIVEDDELNREVVKSVFEDEYEILEAENGLEGLNCLLEHQSVICAVLLDLVMPVMDGMTFLRRMAEQGLQGKIPVFVVTADKTTKSISEAYKLGVMDVITKPIMPFIISRRVNSVIELFEARKQLSAEVYTQHEQLIVQQKQIIELNDGIIEALFVATEFRSGETGEHIAHIRDSVKLMLTTTELGEELSSMEIEAIAVAAMLHDIGKISISDAILNKQGKLTDEERRLMQTHTVKGAALLQSVPKLMKHDAYRYAVDIARHHHECWDGSGYPDGLKGDEISIWSQVVSIADIYDALLSKRCYKAAFDHDKVLKIIGEDEKWRFNPRVLKAFLACEPRIYKVIYGE